MNKLRTKAHQMRKVIALCNSMSKLILPLGVASALVSSAAPFFNLIMSGILIDRLLTSSIEDLFLLAGCIVLVNAALTLLTGALEQIRLIQIYTFSRHYQMLLMNKIVDMDYEYMEDPQTHDLRAKIEADENSYGGWWKLTDSIQAITRAAVGLCYSIGVTVGLFLKSGTGIAGSGWFSIAFAALICFTALLTFPIDKSFFRRIYANVDQMAHSNRIFSYLSGVIANYQNGRDIRIYHAAPIIDHMAKEDFGGDDGYFARFKRLCILDGSLKSTKGGLTSITGGLIYLFVALKAASGALTVGEIVRYAGSITRFLDNLSALINAVNTFSITSSRMENMFTFLEIPDRKYKGTLPVEKRRDYEYEIEFHQVSFKYPGTEEYVLRDLALKLKVGQRMAVVGMNGSGKTTMIKLLCRLYDPTEGIITLNGIDIRKYQYEEYLSIFSVVFQDFKLFSFPLGQNIAASVQYDREKAALCLEKAGLGKRMETMPKGLDTMLYQDFEEDGIEISGGEAQKIALARALYKDAPFIILDEPTAALDPVAEYEIYSRFNDIVGEKTAIYISHRLSSCRFCDDIAVFDQGRLVQRGSHAALLADTQGKYYELWNAQAQYYQD